jgi:hypothetical protein
MQPISAIAESAARYVTRGWKVIQLHDFTTGACSCQHGQYCKSPGKHPLLGEWQNRFMSTAPEVYSAWAARPQANVGIVTGPASGIFVLDVDPTHGGDDKLASLEMAFGPLPRTYTTRTGSGGLHFYFTLDGVDFDLTNSRGHLPVGLDIRGRGGFVVAPPSVSGVGPYVVMAEPDSTARFMGGAP